MNVQYQQERQVTSTIDRYHHEAIRAKQVRLVRGDQPGRLATVMMSLRATLSNVQARIRHQPAVAQEPVAAPTPTDAPAESAAIA